MERKSQPPMEPLHDESPWQRVDMEAPDMQVEEKKRQTEAENEEEDAYDAEALHNSRLALLLQDQQAKDKRALEEAIAMYRQQQQDPNNPDRRKNADQTDGQMLIPGLVGEDLSSQSRRQRQQEQMRDWLIQQQAERAAEKHRQRLENLQFDQSTLELASKALQLEDMEVKLRRAAAVATKEYNLAMIAERRRQERGDEGEEAAAVTQGQDQPTDQETLEGFFPTGNKRSPPENLQQIMEFHKHQMEERKRVKSDKKKEELEMDEIRMVSARTALLLERHQARLNRQQRLDMDRTNITLAQSQRLWRPDDDVEEFQDSFFSQFGTSRR